VFENLDAVDARFLKGLSLHLGSFRVILGEAVARDFLDADATAQPEYF
jgi:hypothetical protein